MVSLVLLPISSAHLLISSAMHHWHTLACHLHFPFLHLAMPVNACDTPSHSQPLAWLPSHLLPSFTIAPASILSTLPGVTLTPPPLPSLFLSSIPVHHFLNVSCSLISPCLALFLLVCPYLIPFSASPLNTSPSHFTASRAVFLSHCHLPLWSQSFATHLQHLSACLCFPFS